MNFQSISRVLVFVVGIAFVGTSIAFMSGWTDRGNFIGMAVVAGLTALNSGTSDLLGALGKKNG